MEFHLLPGDAVYLSFHLSEEAIRGEGAISHSWWEVAGRNQVKDLNRRPMHVIVMHVIVMLVIVMFVLVDDEIRPCGSDPAALNPLKEQCVVVDPEASDGSGDLIWISPGIHQGRQCHVARYSGSALEPRHPTPSTGDTTLEGGHLNDLS
jgi:hypothetical protein